MKNHLIILAEAVRRAKRELRNSGNAMHPASKDMAIERLTELLESEDVNDALAALETVEDAPSMKSDPVDLRVPYPWRKH
jgi:hypothetical protein